MMIFQNIMRSLPPVVCVKERVRSLRGSDQEFISSIDFETDARIPCEAFVQAALSPRYQSISEDEMMELFRINGGLKSRRRVNVTQSLNSMLIPILQHVKHACNRKVFLEGMTRLLQGYYGLPALLCNLRKMHEVWTNVEVYLLRIM